MRKFNKTGLWTSYILKFEFEISFVMVDFGLHFVVAVVNREADFEISSALVHLLNGLSI